MKTNYYLFCLLVMAVCNVLTAQEKPILVYDLVNHTTDTLPIVPYDTTVLRDKTPFNIGQFNETIEMLEEMAVSGHVYENSQFTYKQRAADYFDLTSFPLSEMKKINSTKLCDCFS